MSSDRETFQHETFLTSDINIGTNVYNFTSDVNRTILKRKKKHYFIIVCVYEWVTVLPSKGKKKENPICIISCLKTSRSYQGHIFMWKLKHVSNIRLVYMYNVEHDKKHDLDIRFLSFITFSKTVNSCTTSPFILVDTCTS